MNVRLLVLSFLFCIGLATSAMAEYRVFLLEITTTSNDPSIPPEKKVFPSTLDPEQYRGYYPVQNNQTIKYLDTWLCVGRTGGFKPLCPNPREIPPNQGQDLEAN
ncbi:MAG: hypothetical protein ACLGGX_02415 [Bdellovibrionia bacterium]